MSLHICIFNYSLLHANTTHIPNEVIIIPLTLDSFAAEERVANCKNPSSQSELRLSILKGCGRLGELISRRLEELSEPEDLTPPTLPLLPTVAVPLLPSWSGESEGRQGLAPRKTSRLAAGLGEVVLSEDSCCEEGLSIFCTIASNSASLENPPGCVAE